VTKALARRARRLEAGGLLACSSIFFTDDRAQEFREAPKIKANSVPPGAAASLVERVPEDRPRIGAKRALTPGKRCCVETVPNVMCASYEKSAKTVH
jgi:hypothetical protein